MTDVTNHCSLCVNLNKIVMLLLLLSGCAQYPVPEVTNRVILIEVVENQAAVTARCESPDALGCHGFGQIEGTRIIVVNRHNWEDTIRHEVAHALDINDMPHKKEK